MPAVLGRFVALVSRFRTNASFPARWLKRQRFFIEQPFAYARIKTTIHYVGSMVILMAFFNLGVYGLFVSDLPDRTQATLTPSQQLLVDHAGQSLQHTLFWVDSVILVAVAVVGYYLADRTLQPIEESYKRQKQFVADAAHEFRTPLAVMKIASQTALAGRRDKQTLETFAEDSLEEINTLSHLVDDMLFLAKKDERLPMAVTRIDISRLVKWQVGLVAPYAATHGITLVVHCGQPYYIQGSADDIKRLLVNVIQNAIVYNHPQGSVDLSLTRDGNLIKLVVSDTGIGISKADQPHVFERFYKANQARSEQSNRAGLGLTIVKEIMLAHGGTITLTSAIGKGTRVTLLFPAVS